MTVYVDTDSDDATVQKFWNVDGGEIFAAADTLLSQGWVKGHPNHVDNVAM